MATSALNLSINVKKLFFDKPAVQSMVDKKTLRGLRWGGGTIRKVATRSIRDKAYGKSAPAGSPPYSHVTHSIAVDNRKLRKEGKQARKAAGVQRGLKYIVFAFDESKKSVVIGPVKFNSKGYGGKTVPEIQEYGGLALGAGGKPVVVAPHPFMRPALEKVAKDLPKRWAMAGGA